MGRYRPRGVPESESLSRTHQSNIVHAAETEAGGFLDRTPLVKARWCRAKLESDVSIVRSSLSPDVVRSTNTMELMGGERKFGTSYGTHERELAAFNVARLTRLTLLT